MDNYELKQILTNVFTDNKNRGNHNELKDSNKNYSDCLIIKVATGGASGGNCWNDNPARAYEKEEEDIISEIQSEIGYAVASFDIDDLSLSQKAIKIQVEAAAKSQIDREVGDDYENEYYGNYTSYKIYAIPLKEIFIPLLTPEQQKVFNEVNKNYMESTDKAFQVGKLSKERAQLEKTLKNFDVQKAQQKSQMLKQITNLQAALSDFDSKTYKEKSKMKKDLEDITKKIESFDMPEPSAKKKAKKSMK
jgi:hypothetical protein